MEKYDHNKIESKWQKVWQKSGIYKTREEKDKPKCYVLDMFPYPSGDGLHVGHPKGYIATDVYSRYQRMNGFNILHPMGWDAFGLPAENYAIKNKIHPRVAVEKNITRFKKQLEVIGFNYDWEREINTTDPEYYQWTQWIFLKLYEKGLAYQSFEPINWCPSCQTGLANEDLEDGKCERCGSAVEKRPMRQWVLKITDYADRLLQDLDGLNWPKSIKESQKNWIGRSEGAEINFMLTNPTPSPLPEGEGEFGYQTTDPKTWKILQEKVLEMRQNSTEAENLLWQELRDNSTGCHFRRQHIIGKFIVDFVCLEKKLVVEVDGDIHDYQKEADAERTTYFESDGFTVIRFKNEEVKNNIGKVKTQINQALKALSFGEGLGGVKVFTTRPDTIFGVTYIVLAPEHPIIQELKSQIKNWPAVEKYLSEVKKKTEIERTAEGKEKTGVALEGIFAINPANGESVPVWIADYVLVNYGTGAVMAVPAHDERDFVFAQKYNLPIKEVIVPNIIDRRNPPVNGKKIVERKNVHAIVRDPKTGKYLGLKWKKFDWVTFPMGGVEEGEDVVIAAKREVAEETGFVNLKLIRVLPSTARAEYFAAHKDENRVAYTTGVVFELIDDKRVEVETKEKEQHEVIWLDESKLNYESMTHAEVDHWGGQMRGGINVYVEDGILINSGNFSGQSSERARAKITEKFGQTKVTYKLRDWVFSRQRYWGEPIPVIHCEKCGAVPVLEKDLPVRLPEVKHYEPTGTGESPLANIAEWVNITCPICNGKAKRETNTMPQWAGSSWYYLRYIDPKNNQAVVDKQKEKYWLPVDLYVGGAEHATRHLIYARFWHKFLFDIGVINYPEPFSRLQNVGLIMAEDGRKMSKRYDNVINPDDIVKLYGADTLRVYEMFMGPFNQAIAWSTESMMGPRRFLERVWKLAEKAKSGSVGREFPENQGVALKMPQGNALILNQTIKKVGEDIEALKFNTAISSLMILVKKFESAKKISKIDFEILLKLLAPFAPHLTEELWRELGNNDSIHIVAWPEYQESELEKKEWIIVVQVNGVKRDSLVVVAGKDQAVVEKMALNRSKIAKWLKDKKVKKIIYVPGKLINLVV